MSASTYAKVNDVQMVSYPGGKCYLYRLYLKDKVGSPYSFSHPRDFLSERSLLRRQRQHLTLDSSDLPVSKLYLDAIADAGLQVVCKSKWNNTVLVRSRHQNVQGKVKQLPFVKKVMLVFSSPDSISASKRSNFHKELNRWDTSATDEYGMATDQVSSLDGIKLHHAGFRGEGMWIAVLDGGFMNVDKIPAFQNTKILGTKDFVYPRSKDIFKEMDHGTMVFSTMAADIPNAYIGTAPKASYFLLRCEDHDTESQAEEDYWAAAAEYADSVGVDLINSSLGYHDFDDKSTNHKYRELDGEQTLISHSASMLANKGIVLVNSAGNDGMGTWKKINFPADARDMITVGSISPNGVNAAFCAVGPTADGRVKPDVMAYGSPATVITGRGTIINDMGTSFSAPLVTGLIACLWEALPHKTALEMIDLVRQSGSQYTTPDNVYGYGVPDFWKAYIVGKTNEHQK